MAVSFCGKRIVLTRSCLFKTTKRKYGYVILLPEIGEDLPEKNPLLKENGLPEFNTFTIERSIAAIGKQTVEFEQGVKRIEDQLETTKGVNIINDVLLPLEEVDVPLETTWGIAKALYYGNQSLMPKKYWQSIHNRMIKARGTKLASIPIFNACNAALENRESKLTNEQARVTAKIILDGRLNGLHLTGKARIDYDYSKKKLFNKQLEFRAKVEFQTNVFNYTIENPNIVRDFPEDYLKMIAVDPANPMRGPWKINLQPHIAVPFMELCPTQSLRWTVWHANVNICSQDGEHTLRTSTVLEDIRDHKIMQAKVLGYKSYSHMSMETKMAGSLDNIYGVMETLRQTARLVQEDEIKKLQAYAGERGFDGALKEWDIDYWARKHRRTVYDIKDEILRDYFPLPKVLQGLFELIETLFDVRFVETRKTDVWHADVRFFDVIDLKGSSEEPIASFYLDPYARRDVGLRMKKDAGWMVVMQSKSVLTSCKPLAALIFNFQPPTNDKPSLLSFTDVAVLFRKFGHALQHLLTKVEMAEVAGTSNVEWDAVGISGHFLANWLYEPSVIRRVSGHYNTSEPLSEELVHSLKNIRSHLAGYKLCKELYYGKFDLKMFELGDFWVDMMVPLWKEHFVLPQEEQNSHVCSWDSIFIGNWAAAYYSDLWSEMVAADAYSVFQELPAGDKDLQKENASRYRETFLSLGGSYPASEVFRRFRGRDPSPKALLKNLDMTEKQVKSTE